MLADRSQTERIRRLKGQLQAVRRAECPTCPEEGPRGPTDQSTRLSRSFGQMEYIRLNAVGAQLGKAKCCNCAFNWTSSPIQLTYQKTEGTDRFFTAVFANAAGQVVPQFGIANPSSCGEGGTAIIETLYSNNAGFLSVTYTISNDSESYTPATITQEILLTVTCEGATTTYSKNITFKIPAAYQTACL